MLWNSFAFFPGITLLSILVSGAFTASDPLGSTQISISKQYVRQGQAKVVLPCQLNEENCGPIHSIKWYRAENRVYIFSESISISRAEGDLRGRAELHRDANNSLVQLKIDPLTMEDAGLYKCEVTHIEYKEHCTILQSIRLNITDKPRVKLFMNPSRHVREQDRTNVTLSCEIQDEDPELLDRVRWYLDGDFLKELPECSNTTNDIATETKVHPWESELCDIDYTKIMLERVERKFDGDYTCQGHNKAGWSEISPPTRLYVHYPPGQARLEFEPLTVVKGHTLNLRCLVDEIGYPPAQSYRWTREGQIISFITTQTWTISPVSLKDRANFNCEAVNSGGNGPAATVSIDVFVPPSFINRLHPYYGVQSNANHVSLSCQVECYPQCHIYWLKNGLPILSSDLYYSITSTPVPSDPTKNNFESVVSTLTWNMTAWPNGHLDRVADNANYTCQSTSNSYGPGISSTTHFQVEYPPEDIKVSPAIVNVEENEYPADITCTAKAFPEAYYKWMYGNKVLSTSRTLSLIYPIKREQSGKYTCIATNRHGNISITAEINVQYVPECKITLKENEDKRILLCEVTANPSKVDFYWMLDNNTYTETVDNKESVSVLTIRERSENFGKYKCVANNSVGFSMPCDHSVTGNIGFNILLEPTSRMDQILQKLATNIAENKELVKALLAEFAKEKEKASKLENLVAEQLNKIKSLEISVK